MAEPIGSAPRRGNEQRLRRVKNDEFFALDRGCGAFPWKLPAPEPEAGSLHASAIHGRTERSGCTPAEPYPLSRDARLRELFNHTN